MDDMVNGIRFLIDNKGSQGIFNFSTPNPINNNDFSKTLGKAMKRPSLLPVPSFVLKLALGEAATLALDGQRVMPKRLLEAGYVFKYKTLEDALPSLLNPVKNY